MSERPKLILTRGLPASGKTTYARKWVEEDPANRVRVNRDDLRFNLYGLYWGLTYEQEKTIAVVQQTSVEALLRAGKSVIVDDMNLKRKYAVPWLDLAVRLGCDWEVKDFTDVDLAECIRRDDARGAGGGRTVGSVALASIHSRYLKGKALPDLEPTSSLTADYTYVPRPGLRKAFLVDIDGTLAKMNGRGPFEWKRVGEDSLVKPVAEMIDALGAFHAVIMMSGRDASCKKETTDWLDHHNVSYDEIHMRPAGDMRKDSIVKLELFRNEVADRYNVVGVLDDRDQVVEMWRSIGLMCAQVAPGNF